MLLSSSIFGVAYKIIDIIFPIECLGCKKEGEWLCEKCFKTIPINNEPYCLECKTKTTYGEFCEKCKSEYSLDGVFIASDYDNEIIQKLVKTLKYKFVSDISRELGKLLFLFVAEQIKKSHQDRWLKDVQEGDADAPKILVDFGNIIVIPVPLHKKRKRWRGFNQAEELGKNFAQHYDGLQFDVSGLQRTRHTKAQAKLNEAERKENLKKSFQWRGDDLKGEDIIIVDDVTTTGSTLEECAQVLKQVGAGEVWGLVVAKG